MSKILENKQALHIAGEVVALAGLTYYVKKQNTVLNNKIDELAKRLAEHEEVITKQATLIKSLMKTKPPVTITEKKFIKPTTVVKATPVGSQTQVQAPIPTTSFAVVLPPAQPVQTQSLARIEEVIEEEDSVVPDIINEEDLDNEISEELAELNNLKVEED